MDAIEDIFGPEGPLARHLPDFRAREGQIRMAEAVARALRERQPAIVEAGTGTGKTFAYLVPVLLSGARVLISTGTRTLQDQLHAKDVPLVAAALGVPARIALLKGRSNYLCLQRHERHAAQASLVASTAERRLRARLEVWAARTRTGDLAEVGGLSESNALWSQITSTRDNCLGTSCPRYADCHVVAARRAAQEADVVIVNHHLLLADLALKQEGFGDLLGSADAIVLDEAHQIPDLATQFFGESAATRQIELLLAESRAAIEAAGVPAAAIENEASSCESAVNALLAALPRQAPRQLFEDAELDVESFMLGLGAALRSLEAALERGSADAAVRHCAERAATTAMALERIAVESERRGVRTLETSARGATFSLLPFEIADRFQQLFIAHPGAWIFTSATLSVGGDFRHFAHRLGLDATPTLSIPSPFDYEHQALLYLPPEMPDPSDPAYVDAVVEACRSLIEAARGGAFVLFTSHRSLARAAALLRERPLQLAQTPLLVQGEGPREQILREFREHGDAVLLGTASFWEGVDVKGSALRLVIIDKLPFASPEDPLVKARIAHLQSEGRNAFFELQVPEAALALAQGFGRLIRSEEDRGLIAICDPRLTRKAYGRAFLRSLPPLPVTQELAEARRFLRALDSSGSRAQEPSPRSVAT